MKPECPGRSEQRLHAGGLLGVSPVPHRAEAVGGCRGCSALVADTPPTNFSCFVPRCTRARHALAMAPAPLPDTTSPGRTEQTGDSSCAVTAACDSSRGRGESAEQPTPAPWVPASCGMPVPHTTVLMVDDSSDLRCLLGRDLRYSRCRRASSWFCRT